MRRVRGGLLGATRGLMDALMAALVVAALAQIGDRPAWLAALLADRYRSPGIVAVAALIAMAAASAIAAAGGALIAPRLTPEARQLLLALALGLQGGGALGRGKPPERLERWWLGAFGTALIGLFILLFGDGVQFVVAALAARGEAPVFAAVGATLGAGTVLATAAMLGEAAWLKLPLVAMRRGIAALFLLTAAWLALGAFKLV